MNAGTGGIRSRLAELRAGSESRLRASLGPRLREARNPLARLVLASIDRRRRGPYVRGIRDVGRTPLISVAMVAGSAAEGRLRAAIESVRRQYYPRWELRVVHTASGNPWLSQMLERYARRDPRIEATSWDSDWDAAHAANHALRGCRGEHVAFLGPSDQLTADALFHVAVELDLDPAADVLYSDEATIDARGMVTELVVKPDWSPTYLLAGADPGRLLVVRRSLLDELGGFDAGLGEARELELALRLSDRTAGVRHLPRTLYYRRQDGSRAESGPPGGDSDELRAAAVSDHLRGLGVPVIAEADPEVPGRCRLLGAPRAEQPPVSVVVPWLARDGPDEDSVASIVERTDYPRLEVIVVDVSGDGGAAHALDRLPIRVVEGDGAGASAVRALNLGASEARGELLVLLAEAIEITDPDWLRELAPYASLPAVGAVGPLLVGPHGKVEQAGLALAAHGPAAVMRGFPADRAGLPDCVGCAHDVSALSAACMLVPRALYMELGGLSEDYSYAYHDIDLCLRLRRRGSHVVCAPRSRVGLRDGAAVGEPDPVDAALLHDSWREELAGGDRYFRPKIAASARRTSPAGGSGSPARNSAPQRLWSGLVRPVRGRPQPRIGRLRHHPPKPLAVPGRYLRAPELADPPLISIATPSLNQAPHIESTIRSALDQGYPRLEYIVQDGGSTDGTAEVLERYRSQLHDVEIAPDEGQSEAINTALARAGGDLLGYLNSDDLLLPGSLAYVARYFARHPEVDVVYGHRVLIDVQGREIGRWVLPPHDDEILSWADYVPQETLFWRRRIWEAGGGGVDESFRFAMDWDLLVRFREAGASIVRLPRFLGAFRVHEAQKSSAAADTLGASEMNRIRERLHGRHVDLGEVKTRIRPYLRRHLLYDRLYRLGLLRY